MRSVLGVSWLFSAVLACTPGGVDDAGAPAPLTFRAVSFNTGTTDGLAHDDPPDDGYTSAEAAFSDAHYGNGLAWRAVVDDTRAYLAEIAPDVVAFQELFHSPACADVPPEARVGFVCETWSAGDPSVVLEILGPDFAVACHLEKPDKCLGVRRSFAAIDGCASGLCEDALDGARVPDCGGGSRIGRAHLTLDDGRALTVVNVHGSSGVTASDMECRRRQFEQVFVDLDGAPAADGEVNLVLGDLNTDPGRLFGADPSADTILEHVGNDRPFAFLSDVGEAVTATYAGLFNIDHAMSDVLTGACESAGVDGRAPVSDVRYFDHKPLVCDVTLP